MPGWFLYSLPDGLWIFSYICLILYIWKNTLTKQNLIWIFIIPFIAVFSEFAQLFKIIPGKFDNIDLLFYTLGLLLPLIIFYKNLKFKQL